MQNINEKSLQSYLELFHKTLEETAQQFLPLEHREKLFHVSLLPAKVTGHVSTQFGTAIEYTPSSETEFSVIRGSSRVEALLLNQPLKHKGAAPLFIISAHDIKFSEISLDAQNPFVLVNEHCNITFSKCNFEYKKWKRFIHYAEVNGNRSSIYWSNENAVSRAKNEVLAALFELNQSKKKDISIGEYVESVKKKTVLILGAYDEPGSKRINKISEAVKSLGYEPVLIKDIPDIAQQDLSQKVNTIGNLVRFVVVDDSSMSGHLLEIQLCKQNSWITALLRKDGKGSSWMTKEASALSNVILELDYNEDNYGEVLHSVSQWAERKITELDDRFSSYPWRNI